MFGDTSTGGEWYRECKFLVKLQGFTFTQRSGLLEGTAIAGGWGGPLPHSLEASTKHAHTHTHTHARARLLFSRIHTPHWPTPSYCCLANKLPERAGRCLSTTSSCVHIV